MSAKKLIKAEIQKKGRGKIVVPSDFEQSYGVENTKKSLLRLSKEGFLEHLARGIYLFPEEDDVLGILYPDIVTIAEQIALRDRAHIIPAGAQAMSQLGLSTQVPLNTVFLTDGSPRMIKVGNRTIKFKKVSPKNLGAKGTISGLVIQALKEIGKENLTYVQLKTIMTQLKDEDPENLYHDMRLAPSWIAKIFDNVLQHYYE